ncbi:hypothetical protein [Streptomyces sp. NPDC000405]|uniref:hypothetical protein n=1 Tax=Streptomyces sp. NPDC000405 TaxID=3161033 RepID=UPI00398D62DA
MHIRKRAATGLISAVLVTGAMALTPSAYAAQRDGTSPTGAASCYGSAHSYSKPSGSYAYPTGTGHLTTTSNCSDINIKTNTNRYVQVCWLSTSTCQSDYTLTTAGQWTTVATNVLDGTDFFFWFRSDASSTGDWAA